ncbi:DUF721 domain-containing protein [Thiococcus pfennigii]|uniref:DUF721 domain-containing protein n=1 Tax=Thiococcus pfennigii TaxID=1057 RepID=UPI0019064A5C|nr:DUF721 domain-containing protein [Thiococcus pfennigii]MBK1701372.1 hypothetical protein [Thiococcus pfennigii]
MTKPLRHVSGFLRPSAALVAQLEEIRRDQAMLREARRALPPSLREHCRRAVFSGDSVTLVAESAVWATRLRFMGPEILARLAEVHPGLRRCRVRIAPEASPMRDARRALPRPRPSPGTAHHLAATAEMLADPGLAAAFRRLAASAARATAAAAAAGASEARPGDGSAEDQ